MGGKTYINKFQLNWFVINVSVFPQGAESSRVIRQYSLNGWKERQKYPKSLASLLFLLDLVEQGHRELGGDGPITVHCM